MQSVAKVVAEMKTPTDLTRPSRTEQQDGSQRQAERLTDAQRIVGLGPKEVPCTFANFDQTCQSKACNRAMQVKAYQAALKYLGEARSLVFFGDLGVGKTHLVAAIVNELLKESPYLTGIWGAEDMDGPLCFLKFDDALATLKSTYRDGYEGMGEQWHIGRWRKVRHLVLDEVGQKGRHEEKGPSEFTRRVGYDIIDGRYRLGKPIIITTNKTASELASWITQAAVDRLFDGGEFVEMRGDSYRRRK